MIDYPQEELAVRLALIRDLRTASRAITLPLFTSGMSVINKAERGYDPVTNADTEAESAQRELIKDAFGDDEIIGEEFDDVAGSSDWSWTLDPIDGTRAFVAGVPVWSTLIALSFRDQPIAGLIDHPALGQSFWGTPGRSFREDDNKSEVDIRCKPCTILSDAVLGCTEPLSMFNAQELAAYNVIRRGTRFSRLGLDAYGYSMVASGRMDIIIEAGLKPCDIRAIIPVIENAGGKVTNWRGGSPVDGGQVIAVGSAELLPGLYSTLSKARN